VFDCPNPLPYIYPQTSSLLLADGISNSRGGTMIGTTVSRNLIAERLGGGGMGGVYKVEDIRLNRTVEMKFLPPELTLDPEEKEHFIHEAQARSRICPAR